MPITDADGELYLTDCDIADQLIALGNDPYHCDIKKLIKNRYTVGIIAELIKRLVK